MLKHAGIEYVAIYGEVSQRSRVEKLRQFRESGRDGARVLILSNVGSVGLNIACANILIIVVRIFSSDYGSTQTTDNCGHI